MNTLGRVIFVKVHEHEGLRTVQRAHAKGISTTVLRWNVNHWETVSHVEERQPRPSDKSF